MGIRRGGWAVVVGVALVIGLVAALGCSDEVSGPTAEELTAERAAAKKRAALAKSTDKRKKQAAVAKAAKPEPAPTPAQELAPRPAADGYGYDATGKRDPFRSFMWERPDRIALEHAAGPLEKFDLSQLEVVAVVWRTGNARALVQDPSGESHIVGQGTTIGKNQGHVVSIDDNTVVVKETYVDYLGQETTKDVEMRMRRNEGG